MRHAVIHEFEARYRLPRSLAGEARRLDGIPRSHLATMLPMLLDRVGLHDDEEVCIRELHARVQLSASDSDAGLGAGWSASLADSIRMALAAGGSNLVRFPSRARALAAMVDDLTRGDRTRLWAWRRLALCTVEDDAPEAAIADAILAALAGAPRSALPILCRLAMAGRLRALASATPGRWWPLAAALLREARAIDLPTAAPDAPVSVPADRAAGTGNTGASHLASAARDVARARPEDAWSLAVVALLDADPLAARSLRWPQRVDELARGLLEGAGAKATATRDTTTSDGSPTASTSTASADVSGEAGAPPRAIETAMPVDAATDAVEVDDRPTARTRWGGLLYLLNVLDRERVPERWAASSLADHSVRWALHRLAAMLVPIAPEDAAALAFAGLPPDAAPPDPSRDPDASDLMALAAARDVMTGALREALPGHLEDGDEPLVRVCRRSAVVVADPGWIEVRLALDDVSTEIRRAGLDLDPGWLPWLGRVVRFVYA